LHPDLFKLLAFATDSPNIMMVRIITNGTLIPKIDIDILTNPKIIVEISPYPDYAEKQEKLKDYLKKHGIQCYPKQQVAWSEMTCPMQTDEQAKSVFSKCWFKINCATLENGLLGYCGQAVISPRVKGFSPKDGDYLNVNKSTNLKSDLYNYLYHPTYMEACKYCPGALGTNLIYDRAQQLRP